MWACAQHAQSPPPPWQCPPRQCPSLAVRAQGAALGSARARLLCLLRARLVALSGSALPREELPPTASGARAHHLQSRPVHRLRPTRCACPRAVASTCLVVAGRQRVMARGRRAMERWQRVMERGRRPRHGSGRRAGSASRTRPSCTARGTITPRRAGTRAVLLPLPLPLTPTPTLNPLNPNPGPSPSPNPTSSPKPNQVRAPLQRVAPGPDPYRGARYHGSARRSSRLRGGTAHCAYLVVIGGRIERSVGMG